MDYKHLGRSGLLVSPLCLGTMNFGWILDEADSFNIMDRALELGINYFDTANSYGGKKGEGITEQIIGRWFAQGGGRRDKVVLATKVFSPMGDWPNERRLSAYHIRHACEDSLRRLQTDHIDVYQMHQVDLETRWEEIWQAMEVLVAQGKIIYNGSSNFAAWNIVQAQEQAARRNYIGLVSEQCYYNLIGRLVEIELLPACRNYGIGVIPWSPLEGGLLGGIFRKVNEGRRLGDCTQKQIEKYFHQLEDYESLCRELGESPANVALAWLLHNPVVKAPVIGPRTMEQLESTAHAVEVHLSEETMKWLDQIWPGPESEAPSVYSWSSCLIRH